MSTPYCRRCLGGGTITTYRSQPNPYGPGQIVAEVTETCPSCRGKGKR